MTARTLIKALRGQWHGSYGTARCPVHDDRRPSLSITERDGELLAYCHAGCSQEAVWDSLKRMGLVGEHYTKTTPGKRQKPLSGLLRPTEGLMTGLSRPDVLERVAQ